MGRKRSTGRPPASGKVNGAPGARINKMENYEDTLEEGGVDDFMYKRDQIMFNPQNESDDEDIANMGEEVLSTEKPTSQRKMKAAAREASREAEPSNVIAAPVRKERKEKVKPDLKNKGRFGKPIPDSDDSDADGASGSGSGFGSDEDEDEGWGRQYYSRPSTRREKEGSDDDDSEREEEREMEEKEVKRLQRKQREALDLQDFGLDEDGSVSAGTSASEAVPGMVEGETRSAAVPVPETSDPQALLAHLTKHEPLKLALARELPLVVRRLEKTGKGVKKMESNVDGNLHKGLGWLHYQTLLTYASTLAFCLHLCSLPPATRPDLSTHPILPRLLQLKTGLSQLEELDFDAASVSDADPLTGLGFGGGDDDDDDDEEDDEDEEELAQMKQEMMKRMLEAGRTPPKSGKKQKKSKKGKAASGGYGVMEAVDGEEDDDDWKAMGLEEGELEELMADVDGDEDEDNEDDEDLYLRMLMAKSGKDKAKKEKKSKKEKKAKASTGSSSEQDAPLAITPMEEPAFVSSSSKSSKKTRPSKVLGEFDDDSLGDPTALLEADATDKDRQKRSLQFHTSKIAATSARRDKARAQRLGGDEDVPYRDRQKARDAALRKNSAAGDGGEDLEPVPAKGKGKRAAEDDLDGGADGADDIDAGAEEYYDLVKRRRIEKKVNDAAQKEDRENAKFARFPDEDDDSANGPRALTRAIEKNKGLTPKRNKAGRNPRVKKRLAYEKAKKKVGSQRAVYKGGQAALGGSYQGEKTGISQKAKSRKF